MEAAVSVDLEPNKDGSYDGVCDAMAWFDETVPRGTIFATYRVATDLPELLSDLATDHEVGVHVHPREFGHERDRLAELPADRQRELIAETRVAVADTAGLSVERVDSFRAGRHSVGVRTLDVLEDLGFTVDASVSVVHRDHLPDAACDRCAPYALAAVDGLDVDLLEVPTTFARPSLFSVPGFRARGVRGLLGMNRGVLTATANTLRTDRFCSGERAFAAAIAGADVVSTYMHPYDATEHHDLENAGPEFRARFERVLDRVAIERYQSVGGVAERANGTD